MILFVLLAFFIEWLWRAVEWEKALWRTFLNFFFWTAKVQTIKRIQLEKGLKLEKFHL